MASPDPEMEKAIPILPTEDLAISKPFYTEALGFTITFEHTEDGHTGLIGLERGSLELTLDCPMSGHGRNACAALRVHDTDALYNEWSQKIPTLSPPQNEPWGARTFGLSDPAGNTLFVMGPVTP